MIGQESEVRVSWKIPIICSMYGISTYIYQKIEPNVGKYSIHGASGINCVSRIHYIPHSIAPQVVLCVARIMASKRRVVTLSVDPSDFL